MAETKEVSVIQKKAVRIRDLLFREDVKKQVIWALPKWLDVDRFLRVVYTSVLKNPKLMDCTPESLLGAVIQCAQLGLEPILGRAHLIPYNNKKWVQGKQVEVLEVQFQPGYQGLIELAERTNVYAKIWARNVFEKDRFEIIYGIEDTIIHKPNIEKEPGKIIGSYTIWKRLTGETKFTFLSIDEIYDHHRSRSSGYKFALKQLEEATAKKWTNFIPQNPWFTDEGAMCLKSVIKSHAKFERASVDFMEAVQLDHVAETGGSQLPYFSHLLEPIHDIPGSTKEISGGEEDAAILSFYELVVAQTNEPYTFDADKKDKISQFIAFAASTQKPQMTPEAMMSGIDENTFPPFWQAYERWDVPTAVTPGKKEAEKKQPEEIKAEQIDQKEAVSSEKELSLPPTEEEKKETVPQNPFDAKNWDSSKLGKTGIRNMAYGNKKHWATAKHESQEAFINLWERRFDEKDDEGNFVEPFPFEAESEKPKPKLPEQQQPEAVEAGNQTVTVENQTQTIPSKDSPKDQAPLFMPIEDGSNVLDVEPDSAEKNQTIEGNMLLQTQEYQLMDEILKSNPDIAPKALALFGQPENRNDCLAIVNWIKSKI